MLSLHCVFTSSASASAHVTLHIVFSVVCVDAIRACVLRCRRQVGQFGVLRGPITVMNQNVPVEIFFLGTLLITVVARANQGWVVITVSGMLAAHYEDVVDNLSRVLQNFRMGEVQAGTYSASW